MTDDARSSEDVGQLRETRRRYVDDPYLHRIQRRHFFVFSVLPVMGTLATIALSLRHGVTRLDLGLFLVMYLLTGIGMSVGFHRVFSHRVAVVRDPAKVFLAIFGSMAAVGPLMSWVALHRLHHESADLEGDVHSPHLHGGSFGQKVHGFVHAHFLWMYKHHYPNMTRYVPDLLRDRVLYKTGRLYLVWMFLGLAIPAAIGGLVTMSWWGALTAFLWGGVVRMFCVANAFWSLSSFSHMSWFGTRPFRAQNPVDNARNNAVFAWLSFGEGWHNNHHAFPWSAAHGVFWWNLDYGFWVIKLLEAVGLARDLKVPSKDKIEARRRLDTSLRASLRPEKREA